MLHFCVLLLLGQNVPRKGEAAMNEDAQILEKIEALEASIARLKKEPLTPEDQMYMISATKAYVLDYKERKHLYMWLPTSSLTLSFEDYGSGVVQAQVWVNIGFPQGLQVLAPNNATNVPIFIRCTDEVIP